MTMLQIAAESIEQTSGMIKWHLGDLSDADLFVRPVPNANHIFWQIGHLVKSQAGMLTAVKGDGAVQLPGGFTDQFTKSTAVLDDPSAFPSRAQLMESAEAVHRATLEWVRSLSEADLGTPTSDRLKSFAPTFGHVVLLIPSHASMHLGQIQVTRRKLGKPVLF